MKNAKKSMFITTVLMVAVLIVAVSTATFAWYTASSSGTAKTAVVTSATASSANIAIGWESGATGTEIVFSGEQVVDPMVPSAVIAPAEGATAVESITFQGATITSNNLFNTVSNPDPWTVKNAQVGTEGDAGYIAANTKNAFYVVNHNINAGARVTCKATITGDLADMLLIAVFVDGKLGGIISNRTQYTVGPVVAGQDYTALDETADEFLKTAANGFTFDLAASGTTGNEAVITINAWLDGEALVSSKAGLGAGFELSFTAAPINT